MSPGFDCMRERRRAASGRLEGSARTTGGVALRRGVRLRPPSARAAVPASTARHLLDRPARAEADLHLDDLEIVHAERTQDPGQPLAHPFHVRRTVPLTTVGAYDSTSPVAAR